MSHKPEDIGKILGLPTAVWVGVGFLVATLVGWKLGKGEGREEEKKSQDEMLKQWREDHAKWEETRKK